MVDIVTNKDDYKPVSKIEGEELTSFKLIRLLSQAIKGRLVL